MQFEHPWALLLLPAVGLLPLLRRRLGRRRVGLDFSAAALAAAVRPSLRQRLVWLPAALQAAALLLLVTALARPRQGQERVVDVSRGVAIELVLDRSGSMGIPLTARPDSGSRLAAAKEVLSRFIHGDGAGLAGRGDDLIGLITFARYAETVLPLTLAHGAADGFLRSVEVATERSEDGTAIGDALALAAARLRTAGEQLAADSGGRGYEIKSKVIVLLTDGLNNTGTRTPLEAAELARDWGITIHAIGLAAAPAGGAAAGLPGRPGGQIDERELRAIAGATGGLFRIAGDAAALRAVYREIDQLERSEIGAVRYLSYRERFVPLALAAALAIAGAALLNATLLRRSP